MAEVWNQRRSHVQAEFRGRRDAVEHMVSGQMAHLFNLYGVHGIGKTRLLAEVALRVRAQTAGALVIQLDLADIVSDGHARPDRFMRALVAQQPRLLSGIWQSADQVAAETVAKLNSVACDPSGKTPVYLLVDTTERAQEDTEFWAWLERNLVAPLVLASEVWQVFAGRVPAPWRRFETRRAVQLYVLDPLPVQEAGAELLRELLALNNPELKSTTIENAVPLLADLSFGHPLLSEELAASAARLLPEALDEPEELQHTLSRSVVESFIEKYLFGDINEPWPRILRWAAILRQFDPLVLREYLKKLDASLAQDEPDYFFIQGLAMLRKRYATVWNLGEGFALCGVLRDIVKRNIQILKPADYRRACEAAASVFRELAQDLPEESEEAKRCLEQAQYYDGERSAVAEQKEEV